MTEHVPPQNIEAEQAVIGAALVTATALDGVIVEAGLAPEYFYLDKHAEIWRSIVGLTEHGRPVDELTVVDELEKRGSLEKAGGKHYVSQLAATVPAAGNAIHYAGIVVEAAEWRLRLRAGQEIQAAVHDRDDDRLAAAEQLLATDLVHSNADFDPDALSDVAFELMEGDGAEAFPWPFDALNKKTDGGMRRGEFIPIGGHTSHGKSQFLDQTLEHLIKATDDGLRVRLYMNEMSLEQRVARILTRSTGVPYGKIIRGKLDEEDRGKITKILNRGLPFGITMVAGWSAEEIAHHIRAHRWDVAAVDILHRIPYEEEKDLSRISGVFARCAHQANCVLLATVHLNEKRVMSTVRPRPTLGDIRGSGSVKNDADTVCFVFREQNEQTGEPQPESDIYFSKTRNGDVGGLKARFYAPRLMFETTDARDGW